MSDVLIIEPAGSDDYLDDDERRLNETGQWSSVGGPPAAVQSCSWRRFDSSPAGRFAHSALPCEARWLTDMLHFSAQVDPVTGVEQPYLHLNGLLANLTRHAGETVRLKCRATGTLPIAFKWYKNDAPLLREKDRITVKSREYWSRLRIADLHVLDSGYYRCDAANQAGKVHTTSVLKVHASTSRNRIDPQSTLMMMPDNDYPIQWVSGQLMSGTCQPYRGRACSRYLSGQKILVHSDDPEHLMDTERQLLAATSVIANVSNVSKQCRTYSEQVSCYHNYQEDICWEEYETAKSHGLIGAGSLLPDCAKLSEQVDKCVHVVRIDEEDHVKPSDPCFVGAGKTYRGTASESESGSRCARWAQFSRVFPQYRSINYPELTGHNHCRNPGGKKPRPWCFTEDGKEEYCKLTKCPVDMYPELTQRELGVAHKTDSPTTTGDRFNFLNFSTDYFQYIMVAAGVLGVLVLAILAMLFVYCLRSRRSRKAKDCKVSVYANGNVCNNISTKNDLNHHQYEMASLLPRSAAGLANPISLPPEVPACNLRFVEMLGDVKFGGVWKGELFRYGSDDEAIQVAVLALKEDALPHHKKDFDQEVNRLCRLRHSNVIEMIGLCTTGHTPCMIFEYMVHGDLHEFLLLRAPYSQSGLMDKERILLDHSDFLHVIIQIAAGMEYLASQHFVHCDLATRNCLVTDRLTIKIANLGLIRGAYVSDYYFVQSKTLMPIRWMPPEAVLYGRFTEASDVWAFGVTMWEMYTYGAQPYLGYSNQEVIEMVRQRCLLQCPENCPTRMYSLMVECWHESPARRPQFQELHGRLQTWSVVSTPAHSSAVGSHGMGGNGGAPSLTQRSGSVHSGQSSSIGQGTHVDGSNGANLYANGNAAFASSLTTCQLMMGHLGSSKAITSSPAIQKTLSGANTCHFVGQSHMYAGTIESSVESTS